MATNRELRSELLRRRKFSPQRLSQLVKRRKDELPMSTELATYTLAHEAGIDVSRYLTDAETAEVRNAIRDLKAGASGNGGGRPAASRASVRARTETVVSIGGVDVERLPGMTKSHADDAKRMAERAYPALYVFENSARDVIARILEAAYGPDWWSKAVPKRIRDKAADVRKKEEKDAWHGSRRGARDIDYVLLTDLATIVRARWSDFEDIFPRQSWFEELVSGDMNVPRRVIAHMHSLAGEDVAAIETAFRKWARQLKAKADKLP